MAGRAPNTYGVTVCGLPIAEIDFLVEQVTALQTALESNRSIIAHLNGKLTEAFTALDAERASNETIRVPQARKQGAADGFQEGWHAALTRCLEGDFITDLIKLVPKFDALEKLAEAHAQIAALRSEIEEVRRGK